MKLLSVSLLFLLFGLAGRASAQHDAGPAPEALRDSLRMYRLEVDSLREEIRQLDSARNDDVEGLEERLEKRAQDLENKIDAISRASAPVVLNPRTTAFINFASRIDNKPEYDATGQNEISNRMFVRTAELELRNAVDPYAEAILIISIENEAGKDFSVDAEEAYGLIKRIPILEDAPLGMKLKIGKFRAPLGTDNKIHMHDLPWTTRPLVVARFLGSEHGDFFEAGFNATGIDCDFYLPDPIPGTTLEGNVDVVRAGELGMAEEVSGRQPGYIGHLNLSGDWNNEHLLILGLSGYTEGETSPTRLGIFDLTYKWSPSEERESHSIVAGGEAFFGRNMLTDSAGRMSINAPYGWFAYLQYQTSYWVYLGVRSDWYRDPTNDQKITRGLAGYLSYYTTEFLRFRFGVERRWSDLPALDNATTGIFEVNFVFGSHPTEPYWVNK